jgi:uncharacterized iron-regulated membrane protein
MISKKTLLTIHSWLGLKLSLLMFIVCLTGTFSVISHELDWLFNEDLQVSSQDKSKVRWEVIHNNVQKTFPHIEILSIDRPLYSNFASIVTVNDPELGIRRVFVNAYTGEVQGDAPHYSSFQRVLRDLHRYLLAPVGGLYIVGPLSVILLILTISALFFYKKWWRGFFKLRLHSGVRAFWGSLHKVIGLWSLWFLLLMGLTGTWYLVEKIIDDTGIDIQKTSVVVPTSSIAGNSFFETKINASKAIMIAKNSIQNFHPTQISFASTQSNIIKVVGYTDAILVRPRSNTVSINPVTAEVINIRKTEDLDALSIWIDMADPLHFGNFSGLFVKLIWFFFGLLICVMSASGVIIFVKRIQNKKQKSWIKNILGGMRYVIFSILIIPVFFGTIHILYAVNLFAYVEHNDQIALSTKTTSESFPKTTLYVSNTGEKSIIRLGFDCQKCIHKKHKIELVLTDGKKVKFSRSLIRGYRGVPSAFIAHEKVPLIETVIIKYGEGKKILLYPLTE